MENYRISIEDLIQMHDRPEDLTFS